MEKWLCYGAMGVAGFLMLLFVLDLLTSIPHEPMVATVPPIPERPAPRGYERPPPEGQNYVHDHASDVLRLAKDERS